MFSILFGCLCFFDIAVFCSGLSGCGRVYEVFSLFVGLLALLGRHFEVL